MRRPLGDAETAGFYAGPARQKIAPGPAARPPRPKALGGSIPIRFPPGTVAAVKVQADADGLTVSEWVRRAVGAELKRRDRSSTDRIDVAGELERLARRLRSSA